MKSTLWCFYLWECGWLPVWHASNLATLRTKPHPSLPPLSRRGAVMRICPFKRSRVQRSGDFSFSPRPRSAMRSSAEAKPCAPGPPACCDSPRSASSSSPTQQQLTSGQTYTYSPWNEPQSSCLLLLIVFIFWGVGGKPFVEVWEVELYLCFIWFKKRLQNKVIFVCQTC